MANQSALPEPGCEYPLFIPAPIFAAAVDEVEVNIKAPRSLVISGALTAISLVSQGLIDVLKPNNQVVPVSLMLATIADSGDRKSTAQDALLKSVRSFEVGRDDEYKRDMVRWKAGLAIWEQGKKELLKSISKAYRDDFDTSSIESKIMEHENNKPEKPRRFRMLYDDTTPQALFLGMYEGLPTAGLISDEASGILNGRTFRDFPKLNTIWSGGVIAVDRTSSESYRLDEARLTVSLMVQEKNFIDYLSRKGELSRGAGLWARFLICKPDSIRGTRVMESFSSSWQRTTDFNVRVSELLERNARFQAQATSCRERIKFTPAASALWMKVFNEIEVGMREGGRFERMPDFASKLADNIARVAALLHFFEGEEGDIPIEILEFSVSLCCWFADEFKKIFVPPVQIEVDADELYQWLVTRKRVRGREIDKNDLLQYGPNRMRKKEVLSPILDYLVSAKKIIIHERRLGRMVVRIND
ncbi:hypothetical protein CDR19_22415 [Ectopseudomonas toyotomiensis]|uniref:DUF3987 domain-containing protein n=1 Tax=Ectopseudomonas toyotomiensis TaxID=554344 RepID=A0A1I5VM40_9GAMM|nr:YfjI family protein [Pseudomonas toyotomiensis]PIA67853.1 hypothetical protein CDR19_22415 [Pseudomonas toyotomiensis]SFQ08559.1 Protein of unknown function [Pseudomonas toyotomiensis]